MKTIILAGGLGTRFSEETDTKPKPMIEINGRPILWHIMKIFALQGHSDFVVATGYRADMIEKWVSSLDEPWAVTTQFTGEDSQTGGRIRDCILENDGESFFVTYGDGLGNVNLGRLIEVHARFGRIATVTAVRPPARFGVLEIENSRVKHFGEKKQADAGWINGGYFILDRSVCKYINSKNNSFESDVLPRLALENQLTANQHFEFWQPMDTLREKRELELLANQEVPPWFKDF